MRTRNERAARVRPVTHSLFPDLFSRRPVRWGFSRRSPVSGSFPALAVWGSTSKRCRAGRLLLPRLERNGRLTENRNRNSIRTRLDFWRMLQWRSFYFPPVWKAILWGSCRRRGTGTLSCGRKIPVSTELSEPSARLLRFSTPSELRIIIEKQTRREKGKALFAVYEFAVTCMQFCYNIYDY